MNKYLYLATAALACIALNSCDKKTNEPTPDTDKETTENVVDIAISQIACNDYFEAYGDYQIQMVGVDDKDVAYYASIDILPEEASILGTYSVAKKTIDTDYSGLIVNYTDSSTKEDIVTPDTISIVITANGENYDINAEVVYLGVTYKFSITNWELTDPAYQYEPTEQTTLNETYVEFNGYDYTEGYSTVAIDLLNDETFVTLELYADSALPAGTYPLSDTYDVGTAAISSGYNSGYEYDTPCYLGVFTEGGYYDETYYFVSGEIVVSYPVEDTISIKGSVVSYNGSTINFTYEGAYAWETETEDDEEYSAPVAKVAAKGNKVNKTMNLLPIKKSLRK